ncbi:MAG: beta strand repeat-containing protein [Rariglobus sp.]
MKTNIPFPLSRLPLPTLAGLVALLAFPASSQAVTWIGNTSANWNTAANWNLSALPTIGGDTLSFGVAGTSGTTLNNDITGQVITGVTFNAGAPAWTLNGNAVTTNGTAPTNIFNNSFSTQTVNLPLNLAGTFGVFGAASVNLGGNIGQGGTTGLRSFGNNLTSGTLTLSGTISLTNTTAQTFTFRGFGDTVISGVIQNGTAASGINKNGSGTLTLSGANTYSGETRINGGNLILDYATNDPLNATTGVVTLNGGTLTLKGKNSGATSETIGTLNVGVSGSSGFTNKLVLNANGGSGVALTVNTLASAGGTQYGNLIDLSSSASNSLVATLGGNVALTNGILAQGSNRANMLVKDTTGVGFATTTGASAGTVSKVSDASLTTLPNTTNGVATTNYLYNGANDTVVLGASGAFTINSLTVDSTAGTATLDAGGRTINPTSAAILLRGTNNVTFTTTSTTTAITAGTFMLHNYLTGSAALNINGSFAQNTATMISGPGLTVYAGTGFANASATAFTLTEGTLRVTAAQNWDTLGATGLSSSGSTGFFRNNGVLELAADMSSVAGADFTNAIGITVGSNQIAFYGDAGVSAYGGNRVFNFGGASALLTWGSSGFLVDSATGVVDGSNTLKLSSAYSDSTVEITNAISFGTAAVLDRKVDVANGSAAVDAVLSGVLSDGGNGLGLVKTGAGTLALTATNTYSGKTIIGAGTLTLTGTGAINSSTGITVATGATFNNSSSVAVTSALTLAEGSALAGAGSFTPGSVNVTANLADGFASIAAVSGLIKSGTLTFNLTNIAAGDYSIFSGGTPTGLFTGVSVAGTALGTADSSATFTGSDGTWNYVFTNSTNLLSITTSAVPEPSTYAVIFGSFVLGAAVIRRRKASRS